MSNPIVWNDVFNVNDDAQVKEAIETLKKFDEVYKKLISQSGQLKTRYSKNIKAVVDETKKLIPLADKLKASNAKGREGLAEMAGKADLLSSSYDNLKGKIVALEGTQMNLLKERKKVNESTKQTIKIQKEEAKLKAKLSTLNKKEAEETARLKERIIEKNKELKRSARESLGLINVYQKEARQLVELRLKYKGVAAQYGENSKRARVLRKEVTLLDQKLKRIDATAGQSQRSVGKYSNAVRGLSSSFRNLAGALGFAGTLFLLVSIFRNAFKAVVAFDKEMVNFAAISGKVRIQVKAVEQEIRRVAKTSINTAIAVAETATALKTLGKTDAEILDILEPVNRLSIALRATAEDAGKLLVGTLNAFGESSEEAERFADVIANMRVSTAADFEQISDAFGFLAPTAKVAGLSIEDMAARVGVLIDNNIKGARAGRLLSTAILRLAADGKTLENALDEINKAQQEGVSRTELLALAGQLFGARAAGIGIILADNRVKVDELTEAFKTQQGVLEELTDKQLEALGNKMKILNSAWQEWILTMENGEGAIGKFFGAAIDGLTESLMIWAAAEEGLISYGDALLALGSPALKASALLKVAAAEAENKAKADKQAAVAQIIHDNAVKDGLDTFEKYTKAQKERDQAFLKATGVQSDAVFSQEQLNMVEAIYADNLKNKTTPIVEAAADTFNSLKKEIDDLVTALGEAPRAEAGGIVAQIVEAEQLLKDFVQGDTFDIGDVTRRGLVDPFADALSEGMPEAIDQAESETVPRLEQWANTMGRVIGDLWKEFGGLIHSGINSLGSIVDGFTQKAVQGIEASIDKLEEKREEDLERAGDNAEARLRIEENFEKQIENLENQAIARKRRAAKFHKALAITSAIIDTAAAVVEALPNIPLSIATGVVGALQIAAITAQPIPAFAEGTESAPGGLAMVGEKGREIILDPKAGVSITGSKPEYRDVPEGSRVLTNAITERLLGGQENRHDQDSQASSNIRKAIREEKAGILADRFQVVIQKETDVMIQGFQDAVKELPLTIWGVSNGRLSKSIRKGNTTYKDVEQENSF